MTKLSSTPSGAVLVAIDMAKNRREVLIERPEGGRRQRTTVLATKADYDDLAEQLAAIGRPIVVGFEATGNYHRTLAYRLLTAGCELPLISSDAPARTREALHNGRDKNDPKDAQVILLMLHMGATQRYVDPLAAGINDLQELSKTHETISRMKTQTWHPILTNYLPLYFPEIAHFAGNSRFDWFLALIKRLAHDRLANDVDYLLPRNIPGIGPINAPTILAEAGGLRRFRHHRQFLKFCGLADTRRKAMTALTAKMARVAHAVFKTGIAYRPFLERSDAKWKDPFLQVP